MNNIFLFLKSIYIFEKKELKKKLSLINYFIKNIDLVNYFKFIFNRDKFNPIKIDEFKEYVKNLKKLKNIQINDDKNITDITLVESFINHAAYSLSNIIIADLIRKLKGGKIISVIRKFDLKSEILFRSFGVKKFIYYKSPNFFVRVFYLLKAISINSNLRNFKQSINYKYKDIDVGLTSYDSYIRYLGVPTLNRIDHNFIVFFAENLYAANFFQKKIFSIYKVKKLVQSETQFSPLNTLFQIALKNKVEVFSRSGLENMTIRHYKTWKERYSYRGTFSQKLFDFIYFNFKHKCLKIINNLYNEKIKAKMFGVDEVVLGLSKQKKTFISKKNFLKLNNLDNKPVVVLFLSHLLDGNFNYGYRKNFKDIYSSTKFIINKISDIDNVNWIIKKHPNQDYFVAKLNFDKTISNLIKEKSNIILFDEKIDSSSLLKIADIALTVSGSVGVEYPAFNVEAIFYEKSYYSNLKFLNISKPDLVLNKLKRLRKRNKINLDYKNKCKIFLFIKDILTKNRSSLIPEYIPSRKLNEKKFWLEGNILLKKFSYNNDQLLNMFKFQLISKMRHTINLDIIKFKKNKINLQDYIDD